MEIKLRRRNSARRDPVPASQVLGTDLGCVRFGADTLSEYVGSTLLSRNVPCENRTPELPHKQMQGTKVNTVTRFRLKEQTSGWAWDQLR